MKHIISLLFLCVGLSLSAQTTLYVQPIEGEQQAFSLTEKPKITFGEGSMSIASASGTQNFELDKVQNLSFTRQGGSAIQALTDPNASILLFPNPVKEEMTLNILDPAKGLRYSIYDLNGRKIQTETISSSKTQIRVGAFRTGVYLLNVEENGAIVQSFKVVKE